MSTWKSSAPTPMRGATMTEPIPPVEDTPREPTLADVLAADERAASRAEYARYYDANPSDLGEHNPTL